MWKPCGYTVSINPGWRASQDVETVRVYGLIKPGPAALPESAPPRFPREPKAPVRSPQLGSLGSQGSCF